MKENRTSWRVRLLRFVIGLFSVSLAAQIGTAPLVAFYFHRFACYFWLTNLFISPLAIVIIALSLLLIITSLLLPTALAGVSGAIAWTLKWTVTLQNMLLEQVADMPGASIENIHISLWQLLLIYIVIGATAMLIRRAYNVFLCEKLCKVN
jgi:competence protein ComEC